MSPNDMHARPSEPPTEESAMRTPERFDYSAIIDRAKLKLPRGARMIVWPIVNVEEWAIERAMPRGISVPPGGVSPIPDTQNWGWHEYGMRVGIWRIMESLKKHRIKPTVSINAKVCETRPRIAEAMRDEGWEFLAHTYEQIPINKIEDQRAMIAQTREVLGKFLGKAPAGWLGPGRGQTWATLDYVAEAGFAWFADWVMDDQPFWARTAYGPILSIPYSADLNDITIMVTGLHESDAMLRRVQDAFATMYRESVKNTRILAFGVHPYVSGAAHRIRYFDAMLAFLRKHKDVLVWNGQQIHDWFTAQVKP
jgi:peptidoglycan/xylan/chitin deacetylase (PgdA/CDA1 family)